MAGMRKGAKGKSLLAGNGQIKKCRVCKMFDFYDTIM